MANNEEKDITKETTKQDKQSAAYAQESEVFEKFMKIFLARNANADAPFDAEKLDELRKNINSKLTGLKSISVAFPECSDVMLSLIKSADTDEITNYFNEYFTFEKHSVFPEELNLKGILDPALHGCTNSVGRYGESFPPQWCLPAPCVTLKGKRRTSIIINPDGSTTQFVNRLFMADLVWLFYFDRMGIFKILGAILDDYAIKGKFPITNDSPLDATDKIELVSIVLEAMTRKTKMGISSTVRDRNIAFRRGLGWIQEEGRKLNLDTIVNTAFTNLFHKFIQTALEYYKDKRLATAIQASTNVNRISVATLTSIKDTIDLIIRSFDPFRYGRVYSNTLSGIVWVIAGMAVIRELRTTLGIPSEYREPDEFIPAAYDLLVSKTSGTMSETNRYDVHRDCAENARDILLDMEVINFKNTDPGGELELWLDIIEGKIEGYRTAYRALSGVDLGETGTPRVDQQV